MLAAVANINHVPFALPWFLVVLFFSLGTWTIPITSILDGCGQISKTQKMRFAQGVCSTTASATLLFFNGSLYAVAAEFGASVFVFATWAAWNYRRFFFQMLSSRSSDVLDGISWREELLPMQFRVALFVASAYFQSYIVVPIVFYFHGAADAGMTGMSMRFVGSIYAISVGWISVRGPAMATAIGAGRFAEAERIAKGATARALLTAFAGVVAFLGMIVVMRNYYPEFPQRILPLGATAALAATVPVGALLAGFSAYLRSYKIEPFGIPGTFVAALNLSVCLASAYFGSATTLAYSYAALSILFTLPYYSWTFLTRRREVRQHCLTSTAISPVP
jgi:hypothetical protein